MLPKLMFPFASFVASRVSFPFGICAASDADAFKRKVNIPSFLVKPGMVIAIAQGSRDLEKLKQNVEANAFRQPPQWLEYDRDNLVAKVVGVPQKSDIDLPIEEHLIVELYSK